MSSLSPLLTREIVRVVLLVCSLVSIQAADDFHLRRGKLEIEDTDVLIGISIIVITRDGDQTTLHVPTQHNLSGRLTMADCNFTDSRVIKHTCNALSQWSPCLHLDSLAEGYNLQHLVESGKAQSQSG